MIALIAPSAKRTPVHPSTGYGRSALTMPHAGRESGRVRVHRPALSRRGTASKGESTVSGLLVALPALNEEECVGQVVAEVRLAQPQAAILVIDDGSTDRTAARARAAGAQVLRLPFNLGVGGAMRAAYRYAHATGFSQVVQVDADGQHDPADIADLLAAADQGDVVIGSRFAGSGDYRVRGPRRVAMRMLSFVLSKVVGSRITDPTSGFRLVNANAAAIFAECYPEEYLGDTVEALVLAHRAGLTIRQIPVAMRRRETGQPSQSPVRASAYLARVAVAIVLVMLRRSPAPPAAQLL